MKNHYFGGGFLHLCFNEVRQRNIWNSVLPPSHKMLCPGSVRGIVSFLGGQHPYGKESEGDDSCGDDSTIFS